MKKRLALAFALATSILGLSQPTFAATKLQCENIGRPPGYLTVEVNIPDGSCITGRSVRYSTPSDGLSILKPQELLTVSPPYVVTTVNGFAGTWSFKISLLRDKLVACTMPTNSIYNYFSQPAGNVGSCRYNESANVANSVTHHQFMYVELARPAGKPGNLRVNLNTLFTGPGLNYAIRVTSKLNGGARTVMTTGYTKSGSYQLKTLAPDMVADAKAGADFVFEVELFQMSTSVSKYSIQATGQELIMN